MPAAIGDPSRWTKSEDGTWTRTAPDGTQHTAAQPDYTDMTKEQLQEMLSKKGLPTSGNKDELIERLNTG